MDCTQAAAFTLAFGIVFGLAVGFGTGIVAEDALDVLPWRNRRRYDRSKKRRK